MNVRAFRIVMMASAFAWGCGREGADLLTSGIDPHAGGKDAASCDAGYAALFNGSPYLTVARPVENDFTLELWIKTETSRQGTMFYHGNGVIYADAPPGWNPAGANDFGSAILNDHFAFGTGNPDTTIQSSSRVTTGRWTHVAAMRNMATGEIRVFVDGVGENSVNTTQKGSLTDQPVLRIGNTFGENQFVGLMDEIRIWNVVRSAEEIAATMHESLTGREAGLVGYWRFDDPRGSEALDSSPRAAAATIVGPLEWVPSDAPICRR